METTKITYLPKSRYLDTFSRQPSAIQIKKKQTRMSLVSITFSLGKLTEPSSA